MSEHKFPNRIQTCLYSPEPKTYGEKEKKHKLHYRQTIPPTSTKMGSKGSNE